MRGVACMLHAECLLVAGEEALEVVGFLSAEHVSVIYIRKYSGGLQT